MEHLAKLLPFVSHSCNRFFGLKCQQRHWRSRHQRPHTTSPQMVVYVGNGPQPPYFRLVKYEIIHPERTMFLGFGVKCMEEEKNIAPGDPGAPFFPICPLLPPLRLDSNRRDATEVIGDHDLALSYVLERCPEALPSFAGLLPELQAGRFWEGGVGSVCVCVFFGGEGMFCGC